MARLRAVVVALDTEGDVYAGATVKFYTAGTASASGASTSGTPFSGNLYAAVSGGSPVSTTQALNSSGTLVIFTDSRLRFDVGIEPVPSGTAFVRAYEEFIYDPADVVSASDISDMATVTGVQNLTNKTLSAPTITGQALFANGTAAAPSISFTNDSDVGFYRAGTNLLGLSAGGAASMVWDATATPAGPRMYISESALTKTALLLGRGGGVASGITPDASYPSLLLAQSYQKDGGEAIKGSAYGVEAQASAGFITGVQGLAEATTGGSWSAPGSGTYGLIGLLGNAQSYKGGSRLWGANIVARQLAGSGSALTGAEVDVEAVTTTQDRFGVQIVTASNGTTYGTSEDIGLKFANKNATAANRWRDAVIAFNSESDLVGDGWPAQSTATLIKAYDGITPVGVTAADGIDFSAVVFSGYPLRMPNFVVNQTGRVAVRTTAVDGTAPLRVNASGDSNLMVIDNESGVVQTTVGAAGGASALPATPTGYLILKVGSTQRVIPYYAKS